MRLMLIALLLASQVSREVPPDSSARCVTLAESPDERVGSLAAVAPGAPPLLSFRYYDGKLHHRYANTDLMLDDAGH